MTYLVGSLTEAAKLLEVPTLITGSMASPYAVLSTDACVSVNPDADTTVTLPAAPPNGRILDVVDRTGGAFTHNITIDGNGNTINGAATLVLAQNRAAVRLQYVVVGTQWNIL